MGLPLIRRKFNLGTLTCGQHENDKLTPNRYWDIQQSPEEYSYVSAALKAGFSILTYDRLGTGSSGKPDAYDIVQSSLELEILRSLTLRARSGKLLSHMKSEDCPGDLKAASQGFEKFVHVGHSLGSFLSTALVSAHPELSDAIVLTGFVVNGHILDTHEGQFGWELAKSNNAQRFGDRGSGYLVPGNENAMHEIFFKDGPQLDEEMISYSDRIKQTATVGELMTYRTLDTSGSRQFDGPIQVSWFTILSSRLSWLIGSCRLIFVPVRGR